MAKTVKVASLFDGIGGTLLSAVMCGSELVWASEIEPSPIRITKWHFPDVKHYGDITKINGAEVEPVDIIVGGSPCQDLSVAGKRAGLDGERSGLFMDQIRIVKEMRDATGKQTGDRSDKLNRPRFMVWENVPGAFSSNKGEDFRAVLEETAKIADEAAVIPRPDKGKWANAGAIMGDGWSIAWRVFDAQFWGVPQRRRRIYLVADFGGQSAPEILFEQESVSGDIAQSGTEGQETAGVVAGGIGTTGGGNCVTAFAANQRDEVRDLQGIAGALQAQPGMKQQTFVLQGNGIDRADTAGCNGKGWREDVCYTLNTVDRPAVFSFDSLSSNSMKSSNPHSGCRQVDIAKCIDTTNPDPSKNQGGMAVVTFSTQSYSEFKESEQGASLRASGGLYGGGSENLALQHAVYRLSPLECERLQGYPDGWTNIPPQSEVTAEDLSFWREVWGEWNDINGKKHRTDKQIIKWLQSEPADSARYKALGNSFAIPNAFFVISRCVEQLRKAWTHETLRQH